MKRLLLVALLALLVTGGIAAVYHGPRPPAGETANAAAKAARTKAHVLFDPSEYDSGSEPIAETFLKAFHLDLSYWRSANPPNTDSEPKSAPPQIHKQTKSTVLVTEGALPKPIPAPTRPNPTAADTSNAMTASADTSGLLTTSFLMAGIAPALANRTSLGTNSPAQAQSNPLQQLATATAPSQDLIRDRTNLTANADTYLSAEADRRASATTFLAALSAARSSAYSNPSWTRYFTLSPITGDLAAPPDDNPSDQPAIPTPLDPLRTYSITTDTAPPGDANLPDALTEDSVPEPRTILLCSLALTLLLYRRSPPV